MLLARSGKRRAVLKTEIWKIGWKPSARYSAKSSDCLNRSDAEFGGARALHVDSAAGESRVLAAHEFV
jgi:hypothetical protein